MYHLKFKSGKAAYVDSHASAEDMLAFVGHCLLFEGNVVMRLYDDTFQESPPDAWLDTSSEAWAIIHTPTGHPVWFYAGA
jgi:hypothetical protein